MIKSLVCFIDILGIQVSALTCVFVLASALPLYGQGEKINLEDETSHMIESCDGDVTCLTSVIADLILSTKKTSVGMWVCSAICADVGLFKTSSLDGYAVYGVGGELKEAENKLREHCPPGGFNDYRLYQSVEKILRLAEQPTGDIVKYSFVETDSRAFSSARDCRFERN